MRADALAVALVVLASPIAAQRTIVVGANGDVATITAAVRAARAGDRVIVGRGLYREATIVVDRPLTIIGEPGAVLDGSAATHILRIEADDVTVRGLALRNVSTSHVEDRAAIRVGGVHRCRIEDNQIQNAFFGIYLAGTDGCVIARNTVAGQGITEDGTGNGIHLWTARNIVVSDNRVSGQRDGIYLEFTHDSRVARNESEKNLRYGLHFMYSDDCVYERNVFRANQSGVAVMYTKRVTMIGNDFEGNWGPSAYGLLLKEIYDSRLEDNRFRHNTTGLFADGATRMTAQRNLFEDNGWAIRLMASTDSASLTGNTFTGNTFDVATNSRSTTNRFAGNYWDEYDGYDLDRDGRGDVPHRPVRLFSLVVERNEPSMILLRSAIVGLLDRAERLVPSLTPETLADASPLMRRPE